MRSFKQYINGKAVAAKSGKTITVEDPSTRTKIATVPHSGKEDINAAVAAARAARPRAYAPYSGYTVGAAAADENGGIHVGANMEGVDYTLTVHAEQHTMNAMRLATDARAVALAFAVQSPAEAPAPCGICRQRIREFAASLSIPIVAVNLDERLEILRINRYPFDLLLPNSFGPENIGK